MAQVLTLTRPIADVEDLAASQVSRALPRSMVAVNCHAPQGQAKAQVKDDYGRGNLLEEVLGHEE